jgi:hypothetical protein
MLYKRVDMASPDRTGDHGCDRCLHTALHHIHDMALPHDTRIAADQWLKSHLQQGQVVHIFGWKRYGGYLTGTGHVMRQHRETTLAATDSINMNEIDRNFIAPVPALAETRNQGLCGNV